MDKVNRALCGVEDNAEAIRALKATMASAEELNELKSTMASTEDLDELKSTMASAEDLDELKSTMVSADVGRALEDRLQSVESALEKNKIMCIYGQNRTENNQTITSFGSFRVNSSSILIVFPGDANSRNMYFGMYLIEAGHGPLVSIVKRGSGEFRVSPGSTSGRAIIIGDVTKLN